MAYPTVNTRTETAPGAGTSITIDFAQNTGDLVIIFLGLNDTAQSLSSVGDSFTNLTNTSATFHVLYKILDGSEGGNMAVTVGTSTKSAAIAYNIDANTFAPIAPAISTVATGTSTAPNATSCAPTGTSNAKDYLWISAFRQNGEEADDDTWCTAAPTTPGTFTNLVQKTTGTASTATTNGSVASAEYTANATSVDAGAFTTAQSLAWRAYTLAVYPANMGYAQAQAHIKAFGVKNHAQAQVQITASVTTYRGYAQALAKISSSTITASYVQSIGSNSTTSTVTSLVISTSKTITVGNTIIAIFASYSTTAPTSIVDNLGNTYTEADYVSYSSPTFNERIYVAPITSGGTLTSITASFSSRPYVTLIADEFYGLASTYSDSGNSTGTSTTATWSSSSTIPANGIIIGGVVSQNPRLLSAGSASGSPSTTIYTGTESESPNDPTTGLVYAIAGSSDVTSFTGTSTFDLSSSWIGTSIIFGPLVTTTTYRGYAQAQTQIKSVSKNYAQAQANIKQYYQVFAQAQALITGRVNTFAQAQAQISTSAVSTYRGYAQAQTQITGVATTYRGYAQANVWIKATYPRGLSQYVIDTFTRSVSNDLGTADMGGAWNIVSGSTSFSTNATKAQLTWSSSLTLASNLDGGTYGDTDQYIEWSLDKIPTGTGAYVAFELQARQDSNSANGYLANIRLQSDGNVRILMQKITSGVRSNFGTYVGSAYTAGDTWVFRVRNHGDKYMAKTWKLGTAEPGEWQASYTDNSFISAGRVGIGGFADSTITNFPVIYSLDNYSVTSINDGTTFAQAQVQIKTTYPKVFDYSSTIIADSPIAYWRLDEPSGYPVDEISSRTAYAGSATQGIVGALVGDSNTANSFNGTSNEWVFSDNAALDLGDGPISIEAWVSRGSTGSARVIASKSTGAYSFEIDANGKLFGRAGNGNSFILASDVLSLGWHHVVLIKNGSTSGLYVDGAAVSVTYPNAVTLVDNNKPFEIGADFDVGRYFNGSIDEVALYNYVLSPAQIMQHYIAGTLNSTFSQAQAQIKGVPRNYAQAQVQIGGSITTYYKGANTTANINLHLQIGRAGAKIYSFNYPRYAQAQTLIFGQWYMPALALCTIDRTPKTGNAAALIDYHTTTLSDSFTRYVPFGWGSADVGGEWWQGPTEINSPNSWAVGDTRGITESDGTSYVGNTIRVGPKFVSSGKISEINFKVKLTPGSTYAGFYGTIYLSSQREYISNVTTAMGLAIIYYEDHIYINPTSVGTNQINPTPILRIYTDWSSKWYRVKYQGINTQTINSMSPTTGTYVIRFNMWEDGTSEPEGWQLEYRPQNSTSILSGSLRSPYGSPWMYIQNFPNSLFEFDDFTSEPIGWTEYAQAQTHIKVINNCSYAQAQGQIKQTYRGYAQAQSQIKTTYRGYAQSNTWIETIYRGYAQAQSQIKQTYRGYAQAQAQVKQTYMGYAQAQSQIKQTYRSYAQAQAQLRQAYQVYAQANATIKSIGWKQYAQAQSQIKQTYNAYAQATSWIKTVNIRGYANALSTIKTTYLGYAQAQSTIRTTYRGYAQSTVWIRITDIKSYAQAQTQIKQTYVGYSQANVWIKQTYLGYAQTQAQIKQSYQGYSQAQARMQAFGVNQFAQAQVNIEGTVIQIAQAQARIYAFNVQSYAQALAGINTLYKGYAQAQAQIKATYTVYAQALANIKQIYQVYGQAQAQIKQIYRGYAQANTWIEIMLRVYAQAQTNIKTRYLAYAQSQGQIKQTYRAYAQANIYIKVTGNLVYAQATTQVKQVYRGFGQSQSEIKQTYQGYSNARTTIKTIYQGYAQALATIKTSYLGYAQAQTYIKQIYFAYAQAQTYIKGIVRSYAQATADIKATSYRVSQAQAWIAGLQIVTAQAQASISAVSDQVGQATAYIYIPQIARPIADLSNDGWVRVVI